MVNVVLVSPLPLHIPFVMTGTGTAHDRTMLVLVSTEMIIHRPIQTQDLERYLALSVTGESKWTGGGGGVF
jgi:hypothetical protein